MELDLLDVKRLPGGITFLESEDAPDAFWTGFLEGLAAPTTIYSPSAPYDIYTVPLGPAESLAIAGVYWCNNMLVITDGRDEERENEAA